ncbi:hypothetical protein ACA910_008180 [Epithemia clementina (nom. ined.)]
MTSSSSSSATNAAILRMEPLPSSGPFPTMDPFLFCVYHKDMYPPAANAEMEAPRRGNGMDFNPTAPYRMYHGDAIPGFPQHPHRGFETITATMEGLIDHADSVGNAGRYGAGDVQWMTAGGGVVHSEMFPLLRADQPNPLRFFQIWLNLPSKSKMVDPSFAMFWANDVPQYVSSKTTSEDDATSSSTSTSTTKITNKEKKNYVTLWAGREYWNSGLNNSPPPDSWAADPDNDVAIWHIVLQDKEGALTIPPAHGGKEINRCLFYVEGGNGAVTLNGTPLKQHSAIHLQADQEVVLQLQNASSSSSSPPSPPVEFLLLQGRPIAEPVVQHGPFVMNTQDEIMQAFSDYRATQFGGWPWPRDDMVFDPTKGKFALLNGQETQPPKEKQEPSSTSCEAKE